MVNQVVLAFQDQLGHLAQVDQLVPREKLEPKEHKALKEILDPKGHRD